MPTTEEQIQDELNRLGKDGEYIVAITGHTITLQQWSPEEGIWCQRNERWTLEGLLAHLRTRVPSATKRATLEAQTC